MWVRLAVTALLLVAVSCQRGVRGRDAKCNGARMMASMGYVHAATCYEFVQCEYDDDGQNTKSQIRPCSCGEFWDDEHLTCAAANDVACGSASTINNDNDPRVDPCSVGSIAGYVREDNCRTYFTCDGSRTGRGMCCDEGESYDNVNQVCQVDATCKARCLCYDLTSSVKPDCALEEIPGDRLAYYEYEHGKRIRRACATGSAFNLTKCGCGDHVQVQFQKCPLDFDMKCDRSPLIDQKNFAWVDNPKGQVEVNLGNKECQFDGSSNLIVPRYAAMDWRKHFAIYVEFNAPDLTNKQINNLAPLFSNDKCAQYETRTITLRLKYTPEDTATTPVTPERYEVEAQLVILNTDPLGPVDDTKTVVVPYTPGAPMIARLSYDGSNVRLCVNVDGSPGTMATKAAGGVVVPFRLCSVEIGHDQGKFYTGIIGRVMVYTGCVPDDFNIGCA